MPRPPVRRRLRSARHVSQMWARSAADVVTNRGRFADVETYCMFVGYPRSGHTVVGSFLNAHPEAIIAHELNALRFLRLGFGRRQIWSLIMENDRRLAANGQQARNGYDYTVPGQWQGRTDTLRVIGDKKGRASTVELSEHPELLARLRKTMGVQLRMIHVIRNPYDNIATMLRHGEPSLAAAVRAYFQLCEANEATRARLADGELLEVRHEQLLADPVPVIEGLVAHVGLDVPDGFVEACAGVLFPEPRRTRVEAPWTPELKAEVAAGIDRYGFLAGYTFET